MRSAVDDARRQLDRLREALLSPSPQDLEEAMPELARAIASMETSTYALKKAPVCGEAPDAGLLDAGLRNDLEALCRELRVAQKLLDRGRELCAARAMFVATAAGGYGASGKPSALRPSSSIKIEG